MTGPATGSLQNRVAAAQVTEAWDKNDAHKENERKIRKHQMRVGDARDMCGACGVWRYVGM